MNRVSVFHSSRPPPTPPRVRTSLEWRLRLPPSNHGLILCRRRVALCEGKHSYQSISKSINQSTDRSCKFWKFFFIFYFERPLKAKTWLSRGCSCWLKWHIFLFSFYKITTKGLFTNVCLLDIYTFKRMFNCHLTFLSLQSTMTPSCGTTSFSTAWTSPFSSTTSSITLARTLIPGKI